MIANAWSAGRDNPTSKHRIALELVRQGHRVLWVEGAGMRAPSVGSSHDRLRMVKKVWGALRGARDAEGSSPGALKVLSPLFVPLPRYEWVRRLNGLIGRLAMRFWSERLNFRDPVLINYVPVLAEAMRGWSGRGRVVYHCVDRWDAFAMYDSAMMNDMDKRCCRYADLVVASAGELYDRCLTVNPNTELVSHGVDWDHFRQAMGKAAAGREAGLPVIGFFGLLSEWVDQELLLMLARAFPQATLVLIGKADVPVTRLAGIGNIRLVGPVPFAELPAWIAGFTVGIIPFVVNDLTRSVNPIKLREMLSAGCPVVSTALPEVERCLRGNESDGRGVQVAVSRDDFVARVGSLLGAPLPYEARKALSDAMAHETWAAKVTDLISLVRDRQVSR